jgi:hypothetical protein
MNSTVLLLLTLVTLSAMIVYLQFKLSDEKCPPEKIIYRYVPRNFKEAQEEPEDIEQTFKKVFENQSDVLTR